MAFDIAFAPVGDDSSRAGDAIVIRYGTKEYFWLMVVDGGTEASGEELVRDMRSLVGGGKGPIRVPCVAK